MLIQYKDSLCRLDTSWWKETWWTVQACKHECEHIKQEAPCCIQHFLLIHWRLSSSKGSTPHLPSSRNATEIRTNWYFYKWYLTPISMCRFALINQSDSFNAEKNKLCINGWDLLLFFLESRKYPFAKCRVWFLRDFESKQSGPHGPVTRLVTFGREERHLVKDQFVWTGVQMAARHSVVFGAQPCDGWLHTCTVNPPDNAETDLLCAFALSLPPPTSLLSSPYAHAVCFRFFPFQKKISRARFASYFIFSPVTC